MALVRAGSMAIRARMVRRPLKGTLSAECSDSRRRSPARRGCVWRASDMTDMDVRFLKHRRQRSRAGRHGDQERAAVAPSGNQRRAAKSISRAMWESASIVAFRWTYVVPRPGGGDDGVVPRDAATLSVRTILYDCGVGSREQQTVCGDGGEGVDESR